MKRIISGVEDIQNKLNKALRKEDLKQIFGNKLGEELWDSYRHYKRDLWRFFQSLNKVEQHKLMVWINETLDKI